MFGLNESKLTPSEERIVISYRSLPKWKREKLEEFVEMIIQYKRNEWILVSSRRTDNIVGKVAWTNGINMLQ